MTDEPQNKKDPPDGDAEKAGAGPDDSPLSHLSADDSDIDIDAIVDGDDEATGDPEWTFELEDDPPPPSGSKMRSLDICPNCTAEIDDTMQMVCLKCGYNLRSMRVERTTAGVDERDPDDELDEYGRVRKKPVSPPGRGGSVLPLILASVCAVILLVGLLAGHHGLFASYINAHGGEPDLITVGWGARLTGILRYAVNAGTWAGVCLASLWLFARVMERPLGDGNLAISRAVGLACAMKLASLLPITAQAARFPLEMGGHFVILFGLSILLFRMPPRTAGFYTLITAVVMLITYLASTLIVWSLG